MKKVLGIIVPIIMLVICFSSCSSSGNANLEKLESTFKAVVGTTNDGDPLEKVSSIIDDTDHYSINDIDGSITFVEESLSSSKTFIREMCWTSSEALPDDAFEKLLKTICSYLDADYKNYLPATDENQNISIIATNNYAIELSQNDSSIVMKWLSYGKNFQLREVAALNALGTIQDKLKNPESLKINEMIGTNALYDDFYYLFAIDYSAQNGFGGYARDVEYIAISPEKDGFGEIYESDEIITMRMKRVPCSTVSYPITSISYEWKDKTKVEVTEKSTESIETTSSTVSSTKTTSKTQTSTTTKADTTLQNYFVKEGTDGSWYAYNGDAVAVEFTGVASNAYGSWYIRQGKVDFDFSGKIDFNGKTYNIEKGKVIE